MISQHDNMLRFKNQQQTMLIVGITLREKFSYFSVQLINYQSKSERRSFVLFRPVIEERDIFSLREAKLKPVSIYLYAYTTFPTI